MARYEKVFSEFEILNSSIKFADSEDFTKIGSVGSISEELAVMVLTKKCEGVTVKTVVRGSTEGTITLNLHMRYDLYLEAFGMNQEGLVDGVQAYGKKSKHKEFIFVAEVYDEDGNKKLIAYPRCIMSSAPKTSITNGGEEVAEIEVSITLFADEEGNVKYESMNEELATQWMTGFSSEIVKRSY